MRDTIDGINEGAWERAMSEPIATCEGCNRSACYDDTIALRPNGWYFCDTCVAARHAAALLGRRGGQIGGRATSPAKTAAARRNGKFGGRPRKTIAAPKTDR